MYMQRHAGLLAVLVGLLLVYGCGKETPAPPPKVDVPKSASSEQPPKDDAVKTPVESPPEKDRPAYTVTAIGITEEFVKNQDTAFKKYKGKVIDVEGTVATASQNRARQGGIVTLAGYKEKPNDLLRDWCIAL